MKVLFVLGLTLATAAMSASPALAYKIVPTPAGCSNAGDETARPVYKRVNGKLVFVGYECVQDNRGGGGN